MENYTVTDDVAKVFDELLSYYKTISEQSRFLDPLIIDYAPINCKRIVDLGCGYGELCLKLGKVSNETVGIDCSKSMLNEANRLLCKKKLDNVEFQLNDCDDFPESFAEFDYIVCVRSIHYFDIPMLMNRINTTAKSGTRLIVVGIIRKKFRNPHLVLAHEALYTLFNPSMVSRFVKRFGWKRLFRIHQIKYAMDRSPIWKKHIDRWVFGGLLNPYQEDIKMYSELLSDCEFERVTAREFILRWEKP